MWNSSKELQVEEITYGLIFSSEIFDKRLQQAIEGIEGISCIAN